MALFKKGRKTKYRPEFNGDHFFDYKDPVTLSKFVSEGGKITPARISKLSLNQQKKLAKAVKKARALSLLPAGGYAYDSYGYPELVSPQPFNVD